MKQLVIVEREEKFTPQQIIEIEDDFDVRMIVSSNKTQQILNGYRYIFKSIG